MKKGKLIVFEGIYGTGKIVVNLVEKLREELLKEGLEVYEIDSPDSGRAQLMGVQELDCGWRYGMFKPDFFFELASRARVCSVIRQELEKGKVVLCKNFTISSIAYATLKGHDWYREDLNCLEARARGLQFGGEISADQTIFIDITPETGITKLGERLINNFKPEDLALQQKVFKEELSRLPATKVKIINGERHEDEIYKDALSAIQGVIK
jgi:dTMP kinase